MKEKVSKLPTTPGVYQFFDANGVIIYIGKAKNLKNRVSSYFVKTNQTSKTMVLVRKIRDLKYIVVNTEEDALLLENNLIKKYKPRYNILLKDDKTYPWFVLQKRLFHEFLPLGNLSGTVQSILGLILRLNMLTLDFLDKITV